MDIDEKIQALNYAKERLEDAINEIKDIRGYEEYCKRWQEDIGEIDAELSKLEEKQREQWDKERYDQTIEYERSAI